MPARPTNLLAITLALAVALAAPTLAQESPDTAPQVTSVPAPSTEGAEEIVVTGSYIRGTPENAALNVDVTSLDDLKNIGAPTVQELVRNLSYTSGNLSETNQFQPGGQGNIGVSTINLRGLGSPRTLVMINGRRHAADDVIGVDVTAIPKSVIGRVEALKDGAAALYGSDAIGGVVNFITREGFEGIEISGSEQFIDGSDGDHAASIMGGWANDRLNVLGAFEWTHRSVLQVKDRNWALRPWQENLDGGWTAIANPATIVSLSAAGAPIGQAADPNCDLLGGQATGATPASTTLNNCRFQFTYFDNLVENQDTYSGYVEANYEVSDSMKFHIEGLYSFSDAFYKTSPSFAPQSNTGPDRLIFLTPPATNPNIPVHPGFAAMAAAFPTLFPAGTASAFVLNRSLGVSGCNGGARCRRPGEGQTYDSDAAQARAAIGVTGNVADLIDYSFGYTWSYRDRNQNAQDMFVERMAFALDGLGGPNCDQSTAAPGSPGCLFYNPFSNAIQRSVVSGVTNPSFDASVANDPELLDWLYGPQKFTTLNILQVVDGVVSGELPWDFGAGEIGWAAGFQVRLEQFDFDVSDQTNIALSPCPFNNPRSLPFDPVNNPLGLGNVTQTAWDACVNGVSGVTGPYAFLANFSEEHTKRTVYAFFGELSIPVFKMLDAQIAVRYENYSGAVGSTVDPKLALRFRPFEWLTLRGSVSTTFRAPPQSFLGGRATGLEFVVPTGSFKAVDTFGNPNLDPEEALASNIGVVLEWEGLYASLDYWRLDFEKPFQTESQGQLVAAYGSVGGTAPVGQPNGCQTTPNAGGFVGWGVDPLNPAADVARCDALRQHLTFSAGTDAPAAIQRVDVNVLNGADILTSGIDFYVQYEFEDLLGGTLAVGGTGTYTFDYVSDDFLDIGGALIRVGGDFNGFLNDGTAPFTPKPKVKTETFLKFNRGIHNATVVGRYVSSYKDEIPSLPNLARVDNHFTVDAHYTAALFEESTLLTFSILNLSDENPPRASTNLNYDPFTHDARGRMFKLGLTYTWQPN